MATVKYGECDSESEDAGLERESLKEGDWVAVVYDSKCYPGQVTKIGMNASMRVNVMRACFPTGWKWPSTKDEIYYKSENIVKKIDLPIPTDARGGWQFSES